MVRGINGVGFVIGMVLFSTVLHAAERRPWPRRPGVVLVQLVEGGPLQTLSRAKVASLGLSPASARTEEDFAEALMQTGHYAFAEPDYLMPAAQAPNDPRFSEQWYHTKIRSQQAWSHTTGSASVLVAVLDTGIDATHPDLAPNLQLPGWNVVSQNTDTTPIADHGTGVAGVLGAAGNNALGVSGMNWTIRLLPVRITNNPDTTAWCSDMARAITWAADQGAAIINLSYSTIGCPQTIDTASRYARTKGALVFVAAGNEGFDITPFYPAARSYQLIGATDALDRPASFSNYGDRINLVAPGSRIVTTTPGGGYRAQDGTSFATPIVAGVAALIRAAYPQFKAEEILRIMDATARTGPGLDGQGRVDAADALQVASEWALSGAWPAPMKLAVDGSNSDVDTHAPVLAHSVDVHVYPNPWRSDRHTGKQITFDPRSGQPSAIKIFTVSGHLVKTLPPTSGARNWDLTTDTGDTVASGVYLYLASGDSGQSRGKLAVIR